MSPYDEELDKFQDFPKINRLSREMIITEKIDGTNGQVVVFKSGEVRAGSRNRYITPEADNFGFAKWVQENVEELRKLGPGRHFGEWWGPGIQRGYSLREKRFSLFNITRWEGWPKGGPSGCCHVVPVLYRGEFITRQILDVMTNLADSGSVASPGFMRPEGVVIYHTQGNVLFKKTFEGDAGGKG